MSAASPAARFILFVKSAGRDIACEGWGTLGGEVGVEIPLLTRLVVVYLFWR